MKLKTLLVYNYVYLNEIIVRVNALLDYNPTLYSGI